MIAVAIPIVMVVGRHGDSGAEDEHDDRDGSANSDVMIGKLACVLTMQNVHHIDVVVIAGVEPFHHSTDAPKRLRSSGDRIMIPLGLGSDRDNEHQWGGAIYLDYDIKKIWLFLGLKLR